MEGFNIMGKFSWTSVVSGRSGGFSLIELLIAMAVGLVVLGAMYSVFTLQNKTLTNQEEIVAMQQSVRAGMDMMTREIVMAGYDPCGLNSNSDSSDNFVGVTLNSAQLQIKADLDGNNPAINNCQSPYKGIDMTSQENIIYKFDETNKQITRNIGAGDQQFIENVQFFAFKYLKSSNPADVSTDYALDGLPLSSTEIRQIRITITGRTAKPDLSYSVNDGYRTYTLTSVVTPRNLAY